LRGKSATKNSEHAPNNLVSANFSDPFQLTAQATGETQHKISKQLIDPFK
jgi:hypothetical protein